MPSTNQIALRSTPFSGSTTYRTRRHDIRSKSEGDIRYLQLNRLYDLAFNGQISFSGTNNLAGPLDAQDNPINIPNALIDFAQGIPDGALKFVGDSHRNFRTSSYGFFAQDSFKLRPT